MDKNGKQQRDARAGVLGLVLLAAMAVPFCLAVSGDERQAQSTQEAKRPAPPAQQVWASQQARQKSFNEIEIAGASAHWDTSGQLLEVQFERVTAADPHEGLRNLGRLHVCDSVKHHIRAPLKLVVKAPEAPEGLRLLCRPHSPPKPVAQWADLTMEEQGALGGAVSRIAELTAFGPFEDELWAIVRAGYDAQEICAIAHELGLKRRLVAELRQAAKTETVLGTLRCTARGEAVGAFPELSR